MASDFIIIEPNPIVAMDLSELLSDWCPEGVVHVFSSLREAQTAIGSDGQPSVAIASVSSANMCLPGFVSLLCKLAKNVIIISDAAQSGASDLSGCVVVSPPFTARMIISALVSFGVCRN